MAFERLKKQLSRESIEPTLLSIGAGIEERAKKVHKHRPRSHNLEDSPFSSLDNDGLTVALDPENNLPYAEYIHQTWGDPFLFDAFKNQKPNIKKRISEWVRKGIKKAGF